MTASRLGLVLPLIDNAFNHAANRWAAISDFAQQAEAVGFDTVWTTDELLWKVDPETPPIGSWEGVAMTAAIAAVTERIEVGTWVLSALHRNPGLTVKAAETLDEIAAGRFIFGFGAGHAGEQGKAFGFPSDHTIGRYEDALRIVVPLLREGSATYDGVYHTAFEQDSTPRGPQRDEMRLMLAGHGPRTVGLAATYADIWSGYATEDSRPEAFADLLAMVDAACEERDRDPATLERSIGIFVEPAAGGLTEGIGMGKPLSGSAAELADVLHGFSAIGVERVEIVAVPFTQDVIDRLAEMIEVLTD